MSRRKHESKAAPPGCRRAVFSLLLLIAVGQLAGGIAALVWAARQVGQPLDWQNMAIATVCAALFGSIGVGLLSVVVLGRRQLLDDTLAADAPADQPWLTRSDWASGRIEPVAGAHIAAPALAAVTIWWVVASAPLVSVLPTLLREADSHWVWLTLLIPLVGILLAASFVYQFVRARRFGVSELRLASVPGVVGGQLAGVVQLPVSVVPADGFRLRLTCLEERRRNKETHFEPVWQDERSVAQALVEVGSGTAVPVLFAIPYDAAETSRPSANRELQWRLEIWAELPGVNYRAEFEVPVFKTADSRRDFALDPALAAQYAPAVASDRLLSEAGIHKETLPDGGVRLVFPAARHPGMSMIVTLFVVIMGFVAWFLFHRGAFILVPIAVGLMDLLFLWLALELWLYRSVVEASPAGLRVHVGWLGIGPTHSFTPEEVKRFSSTESITSNKEVWCTIYVVPRRGKNRTIAKNIDSRLVERAVIAELEAALAGNSNR